jgi:hypothetical protein
MAHLHAELLKLKTLASEILENNNDKLMEIETEHSNLYDVVCSLVDDSGTAVHIYDVYKDLNAVEYEGETLDINQLGLKMGRG